MSMRRLRRDELENHLNRGALWAVTYGDLMSYLMIFFLIMFSFGLAKHQSGAAEARQYEESLVSIQKIFGGKESSANLERAVKREREETMGGQLKEAIDKSNLSQFAKVETTDKKMRLVLSEAIVFDSGKAELKPEVRKLLGVIVAQMKAMNNPIVVEGHTDNVPIRHGRYESNWELSMARAYQVVRFFESAGIEPKRLAGIGYGEHRPAGDNKDAIGQAKNRRIEIDLIRVD